MIGIDMIRTKGMATGMCTVLVFWLKNHLPNTIENSKVELRNTNRIALNLEIIK